MDSRVASAARKASARAVAAAVHTNHRSEPLIEVLPERLEQRAASYLDHLGQLRCGWSG